MPSLSRRTVATMALAGLSIALSLLAGETAVRLIGTTNEEGAFVFRGRPVRPFALPVARARRLLAEYRQSNDSFLMNDPDLGWTCRPNSAARDGLCRCNGEGLRGDRDYGERPPAGVLRVALFGDSFIQGAGVGQADCLAPQLESALAARGVRAEVLNFGVSGYGFSQAAFRYLKDGVRFQPQIVVAGLQLANIKRDTNLFYLILFPDSGIPFSKPLYQLTGDGRLTIVNRPTLPIEEIPDTLAHLRDSPLRSLESQYREEDYTPRWWQRSRLASVMVDAVHRWRLGRTADVAQRADGPAFRLTQAILGEFQRQVLAHASRFAVVYLPLREDLRHMEGGFPDVFEPHLRLLASKFDLVNPREDLQRAARESDLDSLYAEDRGHYSRTGNGVIAEALARHIAAGQAPAAPAAAAAPAATAAPAARTGP